MAMGRWVQYVMCVLRGLCVVCVLCVLLMGVCVGLEFPTPMLGVVGAWRWWWCCARVSGGDG